MNCKIMSTNKKFESQRKKSDLFKAWIKLILGIIWIKIWICIIQKNIKIITLEYIFYVRLNNFILL